MAEGTVKIPGVGPVKKGWAIGGVALIGGILAVAYYRHSKNASAAAATAADTSQDPNAIDPATGLTYGEEAAGIQAGDLAGYGTGFGDTSGIVGYDAQGNPVYADQVGYGPTPSFVSNGAWSQAAQQYLVSTTGADAGNVAAALGAYLNGAPLTEAQASIVHQAIAFFGQPPQAGSNGYPPSLKMVAPQTGGTGPPPGGGSGGGGSGGGSGGGGSAWSFPAPGGLSSYAVSDSGYRIKWNPVTGPGGQKPAGYTVATYQQNGVLVDQFTVSGTATAEYGRGGKGLHRGWTYHTNVWANGGPKSPPHSTVTVTVK